MPITLAAADLLVLCLVWPLSVYLRFHSGAEFDPADYLALAPAVLLHPLVNAFQGCYNLMLSPPDELKRYSKSTLLFVLILTAATFWLRPTYSFSRGILLIGGAILLLALPACRLATKMWLRRYRWWGYRCVFWIGGEGGLAAMRAVLRRLNGNLKPVALLHQGSAEERAELLSLGFPVLSGPETLAAETRRHPNAVFVYRGSSMQGHESAAILGQAQRLFGRTVILHKSLEFGNLWARTVEVGNLMGLEVLQRLLDRKRMWLKTMTDMTLSILLLVLLLPLFVLILALIWIEDPGPVFFQHTRLGRRGVPFKALKFRTMRQDAKRLLHEALEKDENLRRQWEERHKLQRDPRVTRVGAFLRKASLDELPQLINVLRGEMSLIGPRPIIEEERSKYGEHYELVCKARPGLTGLWQVSGRSTLPYSERVALDVYYIRNWSIWLDIYVLLKTPAAVLNFSATS